MLLLLNLGVLLVDGFLMPIDFATVFGLHYVSSSFFRPYQFFTYMFVHGGFWHLLSNMIALIVFGSLLERVWGAKRFVTFYLITGIGAGMLYALVNFVEMQQLSRAVEAYKKAPNPEEFNRLLRKEARDVHARLTHTGFIERYAQYPNENYYIQESTDIMTSVLNRYVDMPMVGASGAVFGILMAFGLLFPNTQLFLLFPPIPIRAKYVILFYGLYEIYALIKRVPGDNIAHLAHLSGMLIAYLLIRYWQRHSPNMY